MAQTKKKTTRKKVEEKQKCKFRDRRTIIIFILLMIIVVLGNFAYLSYQTGVVREASELIIYNTLPYEELDTKYAKELKNYDKYIKELEKDLTELTPDTKEYKAKEEEISKAKDLRYFIAITNKETNKAFDEAVNHLVSFDSGVLVGIIAFSVFIIIKNRKTK